MGHDLRDNTTDKPALVCALLLAVLRVQRSENNNKRDGKKKKKKRSPERQFAIRVPVRLC